MVGSDPVGDRETGRAALLAPPGRVVATENDGVTVLGLPGEHDWTSADELLDRVREAAASGRGLVVSLRETELIDTATVRALFLGDGVMLRAGRRLVLHPDNPRLEDLLERTGVRPQLLCCETLDEAVEFAGQCFEESLGN
jgi:anti-anti-sigma factor